MNIRLPKTLFIALAGAVGGMAAWVAGEAVLIAAAGGADNTVQDLPPVLYGADDSAEMDLGLLTNSVPKFEPEVQSRLDRESAQTGDLQISLVWPGQNDLDLHCVDPFGERIWHEHRKSRSGGVLDVDMNARHPVLQRIALVLDTSGSMGGGRLAEVKQAAVEFIRALDLRGIEMCVVSFDHESKLITPFTRNRLKLEFGLQLLQARGSTSMQLGIGEALKAMGFAFDPTWEKSVSNEKNGNVSVRGGARVRIPSRIELTSPRRLEAQTKHSIVLFTDGKPSDGSETLTVRFAESARAQKVNLLAIGTSGAEVEFLRKLTGASKDVFYAKDGQLSSAFTQVAARFKSPFAEDDFGKLLSQPKTYGLVIVPFGRVMNSNWKQAFSFAAQEFCENLNRDGHRISVTSRRADSYFATPPTTNTVALRRAIDSIVWQAVNDPADMLSATVSELPAEVHTSTNEFGGVLVVGTTDRRLSMTRKGISLPGAFRPFRTKKSDEVLKSLTMRGYPVLFASIANPRRVKTNSFLSVNTHVSLSTLTNRGNITISNPSYRFGNYQEAFEWLEVMARYRMGNFGALNLTRAKTRRSDQPVENIFWPTNRAPDGVFEISVVHFGVHASKAKTPFTVYVRTALKKFKFNGVIHPQQTNVVFRGHLGPSQDRKRRDRDRENRVASHRREHYERSREAVREWTERAQTGTAVRMGVMGLWTGVVALALWVVLHLAQQWMISCALGRWRRLWRSAAIVVVVAVGGSLVVHFAASVLPRWSLGIPFVLPELDRLAPVLGWPVLGVVLGIGIGLAVPNLRWWRSAVAGLATGATAGIGFEFVSQMGTDAGARFCGLLLMGAGIGLAIKLMEALAREAALIVHWDTNERSAVNLGPDPVLIGSGEHANLYVPPERGMPEFACQICFVNGRIWLEDAGGERDLMPGERFVIGDVGFEIETDLR